MRIRSLRHVVDIFAPTVWGYSKQREIGDGGWGGGLGEREREREAVGEDIII